MIKIQIFDATDAPITVIAKGTIGDFLDWSRGSKIVGVEEKETGALFTIPILKYPIKITELECDCEDDERDCDKVCHCHENEE